MWIYISIFLAKAIEHTLSTFRTVLVSHNKKFLAAILNGVMGLIWVFAIGAVVVDITSDPFKVVAYVLGNFVGSYLGSILDEKIALGTNILFSIVDFKESKLIIKVLREEGYAVTVLDGEGKDSKKKVLITMVSRKKKPHFVDLVKSLDPTSVIIGENAFAAHGGHFNS